MCLLLIGLDSHPEYSLIVAANRDEFYDRPTAPAGFWDDAPSILAGRDLQAGGTWLGIDRRGRLAGVTNYRQGQRENIAARSRGRLVSDFLQADTGALGYMERVQNEAGLYNGFNLIAGDGSGFFYYSNREGRVRALSSGVYGLSNHLLDTPWPKVVASRNAFDALLTGDLAEPTSHLFELMSDRGRPPDRLLPSTGVSPEWERLLSAAFIASEVYGTRSSTVVMVARDGGILFVERVFGPRGAPGGETRFELQSIAGRTAD